MKKEELDFLEERDEIMVELSKKMYALMCEFLEENCPKVNKIPVNMLTGDFVQNSLFSFPMFVIALLIKDYIELDSTESMSKKDKINEAIEWLSVHLNVHVRKLVYVLINEENVSNAIKGEELC